MSVYATRAGVGVRVGNVSAEPERLLRPQRHIHVIGPGFLPILVPARQSVTLVAHIVMVNYAPPVIPVVISRLFPGAIFLGPLFPRAREDQPFVATKTPDFVPWSCVLVILPPVSVVVPVDVGVRSSTSGNALIIRSLHHHCIPSFHHHWDSKHSRSHDAEGGECVAHVDSRGSMCRFIWKMRG